MLREAFSRRVIVVLRLARGPNRGRKEGPCPNRLSPCRWRPTRSSTPSAAAGCARCGSWRCRCWCSPRSCSSRRCGSRTRAFWGFVNAGAEASMVGAMADWFAVTALFRHPLGLPIPHTALIPRRKDMLAAEPAGLHGRELPARGHHPRPGPSAQISDRLANWLLEPANARRVVDEASHVTTLGLRADARRGGRRDRRGGGHPAAARGADQPDRRQPARRGGPRQGALRAGRPGAGRVPPAGSPRTPRRSRGSSRSARRGGRRTRSTTSSSRGCTRRR